MLTPGSASARARLPVAPIGMALLILAICIAAAFYVFDQIDRSSREHILERVATIAVAVPYDDLIVLTGTQEDVGTPAYANVKTYLERMRSVNGDTRFLYLIGKQEDGQLFFYADSESAESPDYSPPGQIYYEATPAMVAFFEDGERRTEGPDRDRWGLWISGYAPVLDSSGNVIAMLGMDLPASRFLTDAAAYALLPILVALMLVIIIFAIERRRAQDRAHVEQKAEFLSIASHEIRTPLTGIRWAVENLLTREHPPVDPKTRAMLAAIHDSCLGLIGRVNNLLDLSTLEDPNAAAMRIETIDIPAFLEDIADSLALSAKPREVRVTLDDSVARAGSFEADRQMMHHAFFNLLTNAIKYTREGSTVTVRHELGGEAHVFRITDQGEGIAEADQERIFAGYYRTKEAVKSGQFGNGLGLYLVKKAAEMHGGSVRVSSTAGEGSTFIISIPLKSYESSR